MSGVFILAAGGTGGHLFPAQAFAAELKRRGQRPVLITDERGLGFGSGFDDVPIHAVRAGTLSPRRPLKSAKAVFDILAGIIAAYRIVRPLRPVLAVGFGGYPSLPAMIAAGWAGIPRLIHEQNAVLGLANRLFAPRVEGIALSYHPTSGLQSRDWAKAQLTGNPVRAAVSEIGDQLYPTEAMDAPINILVLGGSQGARIMGDVVPTGLAQLASPVRARLSVVQQCRPESMEAAQAVYGEAGITAELAPFIEDVPARLAAAHLVVSRAGASTVAEITAAGRPALLVPYPGHGDQQQAANGAAVVEAGGAWMVENKDFTADWIAERVETLIQTSGALTEAAANSRQLGRPRAAKELADLALELAVGQSGKVAA
jgi:UDP-N-acetylglucosamine--N-acetylmuramyl-(pentapeptide) pyrophosphoryl-undecaprenol N-acetylglucosamine transferase